MRLKKGTLMGITRGLRKSKIERLKEGKIEGLEARKEQEILTATFNMLDLNFKTDLIAGILSTSEEKILDLKKLWEMLPAIQEQIQKGILEAEQIAKNLKLPKVQVERILKKLAADQPSFFSKKIDRR